MLAAAEQQLDRQGGGAKYKQRERHCRPCWDRYQVAVTRSRARWTGSSRLRSCHECQRAEPSGRRPRRPCLRERARWRRDQLWSEGVVGQELDHAEEGVVATWLGCG